jgi:thymidylate synthase (FAD)
MASINEYSGRYSPMLKEFEVPEELSDEMKGEFRAIMKEEYDCYEHAMEDMKGAGEKAKRARETARGVLGTGYYTHWYWKANLHAVSHFLYLRCADDAQHEIKQYANAMAELIKPVVPIASELIEKANRMKWALKKARREVLCKGRPVEDFEVMVAQWTNQQ